MLLSVSNKDGLGGAEFFLDIYKPKRYLLPNLLFPPFHTLFFRSKSLSLAHNQEGRNSAQPPDGGGGRNTLFGIFEGCSRESGLNGRPVTV